MTTTGFTSAVEHRGDPSLLVVRARDEASLLTLARGLGYGPGAVYASLPSDYPFRLVVTKAEYAGWLHDQVLEINYDNFKGRAAIDRERRYVDFLHQVWINGHTLTDDGTRAENEAAWSRIDGHRA